jgi:hypothetical protein
MATFDRVGKGSPIGAGPIFSADWVNAVSDAASAFANSSDRENGDPSLKQSSGIIRIQNLTGDDLTRGQYVQLGDYLLDYEDIDNPLNKVNHHHLWFEGNTYDAAETALVAILIKDAKSEAIQPARILGVCTAIVDVSDITHRFAAPADGETTFTSSGGGNIRIISDVTEVGEQEVVVLLGAGGSSAIKFAISTASIPAASGSYEGPITPGFADDGDPDDPQPIDSIIVLEFGAGFGDPTAGSTAGKCENYSPSGISNHKGLFVFERAAGIWVAISEFCSAFSAP